MCQKLGPNEMIKKKKKVRFRNAWYIAVESAEGSQETLRFRSPARCFKTLTAFSPIPQFFTSNKDFSGR